jgi:hypothetical protein
MSWDLGVPNLGGGYLYDALSKAGDNFDKVAGGIGGLLQRQKSANDTLDVLAKNGALPQDVYQSVLGKGIGAKEQMIGMYGGAMNTKMQEQSKLAGQYAAMRAAGAPIFDPSILGHYPAGPNGQTPNQQPLPGSPAPRAQLVQPGTDTSGVVPNNSPSNNIQNVTAVKNPAPTTGPTVFTSVLKDPATGKMAKYPIVNGAPDFTKPAYQ